METKRPIGKRVLYTAVICVLAFSLVAGVCMVAGAANSGRDNEISGNLWADLDQEVHLIQTKEQLVHWAKNSNAEEYAGKIIALGADITFNQGKNAADWAASAPAEKWTPVMNFSGVFDGRGHTISGLYYANASASNVGLFGALEKGAVVRNLSVKNSYFKASTYLGTFAGSFRSATFSNLYSNAILESTATNVGGIVGSQSADGSYTSNVLITSCWYDGTIRCGSSNNVSYASGILGNQNHNHSVITDCLNTGTISSQGSHAVGISGAVYNGTLTATRCVNLGVCTDSTAGTPRKGDSISRTIGGTVKAQNSYLTDCFGKISAAELQPPDVRYQTLVVGSVTGLNDNFTANDLKALSGNWKMNGSIPVPAYFAAKDATEIPAPEKAELFTPTVAVNDAMGLAGGKLSVIVSLQGNQGISDLSLKLHYDSSVLSFVSATDGALLNGGQEVSSGEPLELVWSSDVDSAANGTLVTLVFRVNSNAAEGSETEISVSYAEANNAAMTKVVLDTQNARVCVSRAAVGDVNGDQTVDSKDASLLMQYLSDPEADILLAAADTNGDGLVDRADADLLTQYLAGQNVSLG